MKRVAPFRRGDVIAATIFVVFLREEEEGLGEGKLNDGGLIGGDYVFVFVFLLCLFV